MAKKQKETTDETKTESVSDQVVSLILNEVEFSKTCNIYLSDRSSFNMYQTIQDNITHQNHEFLSSPSQDDVKDGITRQFYDILDPMIETTVNNIDLDTNDIEVYADNPDLTAQEYLANIIIRQYLRQINFGETMNENLYFLVDDGNLIVRYIEKNNRKDNGDFFRRVLPLNIHVVDPSVESLEDTIVIEKEILNETQVRKMSTWSNKNKVFESCNGSDSAIPSYEIYYRYGELSKATLNKAKAELDGTKYIENPDDIDSYVQTVTIAAKARKGIKNINTGRDIKGFLVFAEELKPNKYKITNKLEITRYKPYEIVRLGKYTGRLWGMGYREIGRPYQNKANKLGNQLEEVMDIASKMVFWSSDKNIAGKNILSSIRSGQIIQADNLGLLNNVFPNLTFFTAEWNRNIQECQKALKALEIATGELLPSSTSATQINTQNMAIGKYFNFKREKYGLFLARIFKRWLLKELFDYIEDDEMVELTGDMLFYDEIISAVAKKRFIDEDMLKAVYGGYEITQDEYDQLIDMKKEEMLKHPKLFIQAKSDFFKEIEMYIGINITGEGFNKQAKVSNLLQVINLESNPAIQQSPTAMDDLNDVRKMLGLRPNKIKIPQSQQSPQPQPAGAGNMPMSEQPDNPQPSGSPTM